MTFQSKIHVETLDLFVQTYVCLSGCKKCSFFGKFGTLCFLVTSVLRFAFLPYHQRNLIWWITTVKPSKKEHLSHCSLCFKTHIPCAKSFQIWSFFLVHIFAYSDWSRENTDQKKLRIWTFFTQWLFNKDNEQGRKGLTWHKLFICLSVIIS